MLRTTILLDSELMIEVKQHAQASGETFTSIVREALKSYLKQQKPSRKLSFTGIGKSGRHSVSKDSEKILRRKVDRRRGW